MEKTIKNGPQILKQFDRNFENSCLAKQIPRLAAQNELVTRAVLRCVLGDCVGGRSQCYWHIRYRAGGTNGAAPSATVRYFRHDLQAPHPGGLLRTGRW